MAITRKNESCELEIPDLGVTMRSILGAATQGYKETMQRRWWIVYKGVRVGSVQVKDTHLKAAFGKPPRAPKPPLKQDSGEAPATEAGK